MLCEFDNEISKGEAYSIFRVGSESLKELAGKTKKQGVEDSAWQTGYFIFTRSSLRSFEMFCNWDSLNTGNVLFASPSYTRAWIFHISGKSACTSGFFCLNFPRTAVYRSDISIAVFLR
jgi:hypothetical protein